MARVAACLEIDSLVEALRWLDEEISLAKSLGDWPECLSGELLDQFRDPIRLVQGASAVTPESDVVSRWFGKEIPCFVARLAPSDALAAAFAASKFKKAEKALAEARSRLNWLRSMPACADEQLPPVRPEPALESSPEGRPT